MRKQKQEKYKTAQLETRLQSADRQTSEPQLYTVPKIIPFPNVSLLPACFQDEVNNFLQEMGYVE